MTGTEALERRIDELCAENEQLRQGNAKLREENERLIIKLNAEHIVRQNAESENAKLRTFLGGSSIVTDYWKDEDGTMHVLTTDGEHTYEYMRGGLADENAKLRELARALLTCATDGECDECRMNGATPWHVGDMRLCDEVWEHLRELGIEVNA